MGWHWHQLDNMHIICTLLKTDNHASTSSLNFSQAGCSFRQPTNTVKALKAITDDTQWRRNIYSFSQCLGCITSHSGALDSDFQRPRTWSRLLAAQLTLRSFKQCQLQLLLFQHSWNIFFGWLIIAKILLLQHNQHFYLDVSVSIRDLHQKKFVQFLFRFLPRRITVVARIGRGIEQTSSDEGLW